jgi:hypothetical protein
VQLAEERRRRHDAVLDTNTVATLSEFADVLDLEIVLIAMDELLPAADLSPVPPLFQLSMCGWGSAVGGAREGSWRVLVLAVGVGAAHA